MAEERPGRLIALRRELRRLTRKHPGAWAGFGTMFLAALLIVAGLSGAGSGPKRVSPSVSPPPGMGAVVGGIEACYAGRAPNPSPHLTTESCSKSLPNGTFKTLK